MKKALLAIVLLPLPLLALDMHVQYKPMTETIYDRIDVESVSEDVTTSIGDWQDRVRATNTALAGNITVKELLTIEVQVARRDSGQDSMKPFVRAAQKEAAAWGANQLFLNDTLVEAETGHLVQLTFIAYRISYKDWLIPPAYLAALPYNPLPDYFVAQKAQEWNIQHFGNAKICFKSRDRLSRQKDVLAFMANLKKGTSVRLALRDGSYVKGVFNGLDQDDQVWIHPSGLGGFISYRSVRPQDIEIVGILN